MKNDSLDHCSNFMSLSLNFGAGMARLGLADFGYSCSQAQMCANITWVYFTYKGSKLSLLRILI